MKQIITTSTILTLSLLLFSGCEKKEDTDFSKITNNSSTSVSSDLISESSTIFSSSETIAISTESVFEPTLPESLPLIEVTSSYEEFQPEVTELIDSLSAIESAKYFMAGDNDISMVESYSFMDDIGMMHDENSRPYYSIRVRQNPQGDFKSMAIGNITVYADTGECFWQ